ncbi:MAG: hypothetical protein JW725_04070 [Candidatus Babeliaceae bacterium]|nr:hypothetical protein [Candidatus Babeliaceae bacterium]
MNKKIIFSMFVVSLLSGSCNLFAVEEPPSDSEMKPVEEKVCLFPKKKKFRKKRGQGRTLEQLRKQAHNNKFPVFIFYKNQKSYKYPY